MRILVTGGAGFIGSHVVDAYLAAGHEVGVLDDLSTGKHSQVPSGAKFYEGDIADTQSVARVFAQFEPEVVNHHAAQISVVRSVADPLVDGSNNVLGTIALLEAYRRLERPCKFIYATSGGAMYGTPSQLPCPETAPADPISPYGLSKHTAERYVWLYSRLYGITATVLRYSNVFGPRQDPHGEAGVCAIFTNRMLASEPVTIFGDGSQTRDYVYVGDVARANLLALERGAGEAINICTQIGTSTKEVAELLASATEYELQPVQAAGRPGEIQAVILDRGLAKHVLGWEPGVSFADGIAQTVVWAKAGSY
jgi:UDP-glucose 4-epimerase